MKKLEKTEESKQDHAETSAHRVDILKKDEEEKKTDIEKKLPHPREYGYL